MDRPNLGELYRVMGYRVKSLWNQSLSRNTYLSYFIPAFFLPQLPPIRLLYEDFCESSVSAEADACFRSDRLKIYSRAEVCLLWFDIEPSLPFLGHTVTSSLILWPMVFDIYKRTTSYLPTLSLCKFKFQIGCNHRWWLETIRVVSHIECYRVL